MGDPYTDVTVTNYNDDAPADDGSQVPSNRVNYSTVKQEIGDPLKSALEQDISNTSDAFDRVAGGITSTTAPYTIQSTDQGKTVRITSSGTVTTADATSVGSPFKVTVLNDSDGDVTLDGNGSQTVDGEDSITIPAGAGVDLDTEGSDWFTGGRGRIQGTESFVQVLPKDYISDFDLSAGTDSQHDIDIPVCEARDADDSFNLSLSSALTKQIDASWAAGNNAGGFPTGLSLSANTRYRIFLVDDGSGNTDAGFDTASDASNLLSDTGGSKYREVGWLRTDGSSNISGVGTAGKIYTAVLQQTEDDGTSGTEPSTTGSYQTSKMNSVASDPAGLVGLSSNQFTLGPGAYLIQGRQVFSDSSNNFTVRLRLRNITDGTTVAQGLSVNGRGVQGRVDTVFPDVHGFISIDSSKSFSLQHIASHTSLQPGDDQFSVGDEVYAEVVITGPH